MGEGNVANPKIAIDPNIWHGQAVVKGTRIPVHQIVRMLANGDSIDELLKDYPSLSRDDVLACLEYAASLAEEQLLSKLNRQTIHDRVLLAVNQYLAADWSGLMVVMRDRVKSVTRPPRR